MRTSGFLIRNQGLYLYPPDGLDPNELEIRGKVQSYAFDIIKFRLCRIKNIEFFQQHLDLQTVIMVW